MSVSGDLMLIKKEAAYHAGKYDAHKYADKDGDKDTDKDGDKDGDRYGEKNKNTQNRSLCRREYAL